MEVLKEKPAGESAPRKVLTREQRRIIERIESEAQETHNALVGKFMDFFINSDDPEGFDVQERIRQLSAKWKVYCTRRKLAPEVFEHVQRFCHGIIEEYKANKKAETPVTPEVV